MKNTIFAVIILALSFLIYIYPLAIFAHLLFATSIFKPIFLIPTIIIAVAISVYFRTHAKSPLLSLPIYYGIGIGFIWFCVFNLGLLSTLAMPELSFEIGLVCLFVSVLACLKSISNGRHISKKTLHISSPKITKQYNLVFISDIHLGSNPKQHLEKICTKINRLDYDYLLIGGDLYDSSALKPEDLMPLTAIQKPILFVTGNHEYYVKNHAAKIANLAKYNIKILDNESVLFNELNIIGISDNQAPKPQSEIAHLLVNHDAFNLLMVHKPSIWESAPDNTDLMLSGHTHNGQIFPFNFFVRLQFKTVYGIYKRVNSTLYVSSGSGTWGPRMRLGTKNEIVHISISP